MRQEIGVGEVPAAASAGPAEALRRGVELAITVVALVLLAPVFGLCALAVALESRGPVFYRCKRVGRNGVEFDMLKFRKMRHGATGSPLTGANDERFTRVGRRLAKWKLDELPQLLNVLRSEMSIVGPRPEDPNFVALAADEFAEVLTVRPGITGLSQLAYACESEVLDREHDRVEGYLRRVLPQKLTLDRLYAREQTLGMDLRIMWWTFLAVAARRDVAVHRETGRLGVRRRPALAPESVPSRVRA